jgi:Flp pilus assembly protein TadG
MIGRFLYPARDERGTSAVELGLLAPILSMFLVGLVDISRAVSERLRLEQAAQRAIERQMQGQEPSSTFSNIASDAAAAADVAVANVTVTPWRECNGTTVGSGSAYYTTSCTAGQTEAGYLRVEVTKAFTPTFSTRFFPGANANGTVTITGKAGIRIK